MEHYRGRMLDHLPHLELAVACACLEEEVVREILDDVSRREDVIAVPWPTLRVLGKRALTTHEGIGAEGQLPLAARATSSALDHRRLVSRP